MTDLTQDELTVLLIAAKGESMMPIGRWKDPARSLVTKGLLSATKSPQDPEGMFNLRITPAGQAAAEHEDTIYDSQLGQMINTSNAIAHEQKKVRAHAEQIAVQLVDLAEAASRVTGESRVDALRQWTKVIMERSLEMINGR
jgi:hypothetical protein